MIGGGGQAKVVLNILYKLQRYHVLGYTDLLDRGRISGLAYLGADADLGALTAKDNQMQAVLAVGQVGLGKHRQELWSRLARLPLAFPPVISPDAIVNEGITIGAAAVVMDGAVINPGATLGCGVIVNTGSIIEHDVALADWVHIAPGATVCGGSKIGRFSMIGAGATLIQGISVAEGCFIGAGATVVRDLMEPGVYVGCPARRIA